MSRYILLLAKCKGRGRPFSWMPHCEQLGCQKRWKSLSFCKIWNNPPPPSFLLDPLTNKHCRTWSSMIHLWIDSRTYQKQRSSNYFEPSKENVLGNMMLPDWPGKFFMIWFHKILNLIFRTQPLCPTNICTYWTLKKTTLLDSFLGNFFIP